jgi:hypothetical protein
VAKASWRKNKSSGDAELRRFWARASLLWLLRGCNGLSTIRVFGVDNTKLNKVSLWGLSVVSTVAKKDGGVASWRRTVVTLMLMRFNGLKNLPWWGEEREAQCTTLYIRDGNQEKLSKSFSRSWVYFPARFRGFEGYGYGSRRKRDGRLLHVDFSRTLTARENFYFYCFHLASRKGIDATRSSRFAAREQVDRDFQKTTTKKRKANKRVP